MSDGHEGKRVQGVFQKQFDNAGGRTNENPNNLREFKKLEQSC